MRVFDSKLIIASVLALFVLTLTAAAQDADQRSMGGRVEQPDPPKGIQEMMKKMQIDQAKKDYEEMLDRGQQALKISEEVERDYSAKSQLTRADLDKLDDLEKLIKKIRGELGGGDSDDSDTDDSKEDRSPDTPADAIKALGSLTTKLVDELKKTSRFGISAVAIESSNAVLKVVKFLRFSK